jgi:hypothetical protein
MLNTRLILLFALVMLFLNCTENPSGSRNNDNDSPSYSTLSTTEFIEPQLPASQIEELSSSLTSEFGAIINPAVKTQIDRIAGTTAGSGKILADTILPANAFDTLIIIGLEAVFKGNLSTALYAYLAAAEITPCANAYSKIGFVLNYLERWGEARVFLLASRDLDSTHAATRINLSYSYNKLGSIERAIFELRKAVNLMPGNSEVRIRLAQLYIDAGKPDLARSMLNQAKIFDPNNPQIQTMLASLPAEGSETPPPAFDIDPNNPPSSYTVITDSIAACWEVINSTMLDILADENNISFNLDQDFQNDTRASNDIASACFNACQDEGCEAQCLADECERNTEILRNIVSQEELLPPSIELKMSRAITEYQTRTFSILLRNPEAIDYAIASDMVYFNIKSAEDFIDSSYAISQYDINIWSQDVAYTCEEAARAWNAVDWEAYYSENNSDFDFDVCLVSICINVGGGNASFSFNSGIIQFELAYDMKSGDFGFGVGTGLNIGPAEAGVMLKISTTGTQITGDFGIGGPIPIKSGFKYDLINL